MHAFEVEVTTNLNLQKMKIDLEDAKVVTKKVLNKSINLGHTVADFLIFYLLNKIPPHKVILKGMINHLLEWLLVKICCNYL